jgi:RNA-binding protein
MTTLTNKQIRHLRSLAHDTKPVVIVGDKGLTQSVVDEICNALETHELIKVKIRTDDRDERQSMIDSIVKKTNAEKIQRVGHIVTLFKRNNEAKIALPKK